MNIALARVVETCAGLPSQWDAWTTDGQYLYLRYRHGQGTVDQQPGQDTDSWRFTADTTLCRWDDGTGGGDIELAEFLRAAGLELAPGVEVER